MQRLEIRIDTGRKTGIQIVLLQRKKTKIRQFRYLIGVDIPNLKILKCRNVLRGRRGESNGLTWKSFCKCTTQYLCFLGKLFILPELQFFSYRNGIMSYLPQSQCSDQMRPHGKNCFVYCKYV